MGESITAYLTQWASGEKTTGTKYVCDPFMLINLKFANKMKHDKIVLHLFNERNPHCKTGEYIELAQLQYPSQAWYNWSIGRCVEAGQDDWLALGVLRTTWQCDGKAKVMGKNSIKMFHLSKFSRAGYQRWKKQRKLHLTSGCPDCHGRCGALMASCKVFKPLFVQQRPENIINCWCQDQLKKYKSSFSEQHQSRRCGDGQSTYSNN